MMRIEPTSCATSKIRRRSISSRTPSHAGRARSGRRPSLPCSTNATHSCTDPLMRAVIGQARSSFDFRWMMDTRKILLCNLAKGSIGDDNSRLLGSLIVLKEKLAALSRQDIPEADRVPHVLYCEEAHNFIGDFEGILAEARKFNFLIVLATQGIESLSREAA